jgi:hypothetical protein
MIPINTAATQQLVLNYVVPTPIPSPEPPTNTAVIEFVLQKNTTLVGVINSAYFRADAPIQLTQIPRLTGGPPSQPTFSEYGVNARNIYKCGWALSPTQPGFGVYNGEVERSFGVYQLTFGTGSSTAGTYQYSNNAAQNSSTTLFFNVVNAQGTSNVVLFQNMEAGDMIILNSGIVKQLWIVQSGPANIGAAYSVSVLPPPGYSNANITDLTNVTFTADIFSSQQNAPKILSDNLGAYFLNKGGSSLEEIYLCSVAATAKAYKYVPMGANMSLSFQTRVHVPAPLVNNVVSADSVSFNNNYSNIMLCASDKNPDEWFLISSYGNVGFTNN